jgi:hypothetical protein
MKVRALRTKFGLWFLQIVLQTAPRFANAAFFGLELRSKNIKSQGPAGQHTQEQVRGSFFISSSVTDAVEELSCQHRRCMGAGIRIAGSLRDSVGSTDASASLPARVGVVGRMALA